MELPNEIKHGIWLLWVGTGVVCRFYYESSSVFSFVSRTKQKKTRILQASAGHVLGYHWFISQSCGLMFFAAWAILNLDQRVVLRGLLFMLIEAFFKEFDNSMCDVYVTSFLSLYDINKESLSNIMRQTAHTEFV